VVRWLCCMVVRFPYPYIAWMMTGWGDSKLATARAESDFMEYSTKSQPSARGADQPVNRPMKLLLVENGRRGHRFAICERHRLRCGAAFAVSPRTTLPLPTVLPSLFTV
jgi:hypothetical protein